MHRYKPMAKCLLLLMPFAFLVAAAPPAGKYSRRTPIVKAVQRAGPAVVNLNTTRIVRQWADWPFNNMVMERKVPSLGTGSIISRLGYIVTNWHVVRDVDTIKATLYDKTTYPARLVVRDPDIDLAILKIDADTPLPQLTLGSSSDLMIGETVIAVGNPFGYEQTVTTGVVSALGRSIRHGDSNLIYRDLIQTDASINPGNSGGPLLNINGEMIGMNTAIRTGAQNIGFAMPVDTIKRGVSRLLSIKRVRRTWHGAVVRELTAEELAQGPGAAIAKIEPASPAAKAGLRAGDIVVALAQQKVTNTIDFEVALMDKQVGAPVAVTYLREGAGGTARLVLQQAPVPEVVAESWRRMGIEVDVISKARRAQLPKAWKGGIRIARVHTRSPAAWAHLRAGDIIVALAGYRVTSLSDLAYILKHIEERMSVRMYILRNNETLSTLIFVAAPAENS